MMGGGDVRRNGYATHLRQGLSLSSPGCSGIHFIEEIGLQLPSS